MSIFGEIGTKFLEVSVSIEDYWVKYVHAL